MEHASACLCIQSLAPDPGAIQTLQIDPRGQHACFGRDQIDQIAEELARVDRREKPKGIYTTINAVSPQLLARANGRLATEKIGGATAEDVARRSSILIDIDTQRPKNGRAGVYPRAAGRVRCVHSRALAREQRGDRRSALAETHDGNLADTPDVRNHRSLSVVRAKNAQRIPRIQNRVTTCTSYHSLSSK